MTPEPVLCVLRFRFSVLRFRTQKYGLRFESRSGVAFWFAFWWLLRRRLQRFLRFEIACWCCFGSFFRNRISICVTLSLGNRIFLRKVQQYRKKWFSVLNLRFEIAFWSISFCVLGVPLAIPLRFGLAFWACVLDSVILRSGSNGEQQHSFFALVRHSSGKNPPT